MIHMTFKHVKEMIQWLIFQGEFIACIDSLKEYDLAIPHSPKHKAPTYYSLWYWPKQEKADWQDKMIDHKPMANGMMFHTDAEAEKWIAQFSDVVFDRK